MSLLFLGSPRSSPIVLRSFMYDTALNACGICRRENSKSLNLWYENLFELIITNSDVFVLIDLCIYMKRRTTYDLRQAWKKARAKAYSGIFSCTLNISCSQLCNFIVKRQVIVRWNFISFSNDYLSQFLIKEKYKNCICYKLCGIAVFLE